jgi:shikimate dehydrogenase
MNNNALKYAVFGKPILHSKSPQIFNSAFRAENRNAFYTRIRPETAAEIKEIIINLDMNGGNITTPFKEDIIPFLDSVDSAATLIHGVNTFVHENGKIAGYNTDWMGVVNAIQESGTEIKGKRCLVLGAGPAGRAAAYGLTAKGGNVSLVNRTHEKALQFASKINCAAVEIQNLSKVLNTFEIIVSSTLPDANPLFGMTLNKNALVLDANYRPSDFRQMALEQGCRLISGKRWLLYQAQAALQLFTGNLFEIKVLEKELHCQLQKENLKIGIFKDQVEPDTFHNLDFIVTTKQNGNTGVQNIIDEEIQLAF